jgi:hypothetical protein
LQPQEAECPFARSLSSLVALRNNDVEKIAIRWNGGLFYGDAARLDKLSGSSIGTCFSFRQVRPSGDIRCTPDMRKDEATYNQCLRSYLFGCGYKDGLRNLL